MTTKTEFMKPKLTFGDTLKFTPYAYAKLLWMRDKGPTEVAGYCVTGTENPLLITDFRLIKQKCTSITFDLDTQDAINYADSMIDAGIPPWACLNILCHSHPGNSPQPSFVDEENFKKAFSHPDWAIMLIIAKDDSTYCRLKSNIGPGIIKLLEVKVDFTKSFKGSDYETWDLEYKEKVEIKHQIINNKTMQPTSLELNTDTMWYDSLIDEWDGNDIISTNDLRQTKDLEDIACFWDSNGNVLYWDENNDTWYSYDPVNKIWFIEQDDDDGKSIEIEEPQKEWTKYVVEWSIEYVSERNVVNEFSEES